MRIKTLLYGGSFDPPHIGHLHAALTALEHTGFSELWIIPCYSDAFGQKNLSSPEHRVAMLKSLVNSVGDSRLRICLAEIEMGNRAGTYALVKHLTKCYPYREFCYVIGSDQAEKIRQWRNSRDLLKTIPFLVVNRRTPKRPEQHYVGVIPSINWSFKSPHRYIRNHFPENMEASSIIRKFFELQEGPVFFGHPYLLPEVNEYVMNHKLYKKGVCTHETT